MEIGTALAIGIPFISLLGSLVGLIWHMHNKRLDAISRRVDQNHDLVCKQASEDRQNTRMVMKEDRDKNSETAKEMFHDIKEIMGTIGNVERHIGDLRSDIAENYIRRGE